MNVSCQNRAVVGSSLEERGASWELPTPRMASNRSSAISRPLRSALSEKEGLTPDTWGVGGFVFDIQCFCFDIFLVFVFEIG